MKKMNLIQEICLAKNKINNTPKWKFISRKKAINIFEENMDKFKSLDIFDSSDILLTFLLGIDWLKIDSIPLLKGVLFSTTNLTLKVNENTEVVYLAKMGMFNIKDESISYSIYKNSRPSRSNKDKWNILTDSLKEKYVEIVTELANHVK